MTKKMCEIDWCKNKRFKLGLCRKHYNFLFNAWKESIRKHKEGEIDDKRRSKKK